MVPLVSVMLVVVAALYGWAAAVARLGLHRFVFCAGHGPSLTALSVRGGAFPRLVVQLRPMSWDAPQCSLAVARLGLHRFVFCAGHGPSLAALSARGCAFPRLVVQRRPMSWVAPQRSLAWGVHHRLLGAHCRLMVLFAVGCACRPLAAQRCLTLWAAMWGLLVPFAGGVRCRVASWAMWLVMMGGIWWG